MSRAIRGAGIAVLIIGIILTASMSIIQFPTTTQVPYQVQVPYQAIETQTQNLDHKENYQIASGHIAYSNFTLEAGKTLVFTWDTDSAVSCYVFNPTQWGNYRLLGITFSSLASRIGSPSGTIKYQVQDTGFYYVVIRNPSSMNPVNVASYRSDIQWQQEVTKYRTETHYRTETIYTSNAFGINLGISILVLGSIITALSFVNRKPKSAMNKQVNYQPTPPSPSVPSVVANKRYCPKCGAEVAVNAHFCQNCSNALDGSNIP